MVLTWILNYFGKSKNPLCKADTHRHPPKKLILNFENLQVKQLRLFKHKLRRDEEKSTRVKLTCKIY